MTNEEIYAASKKRVDAILSSTTKIATVNSIDLKEAALKENGVKGWMAAMVIDIRNAAPLFKEEEPLDIARIVRAFYGEVAAILRGNKKLLRLTIEGDKMIAYYNTPGQEDLVSLLEDAIYVNTFNEMLQRSLDKKNMATFEIGIGLSTSECLVIKTGNRHRPPLFRQHQELRGQRQTRILGILHQEVLERAQHVVLPRLAPRCRLRRLDRKEGQVSLAC